jgi:hypothetical protein
LLPGFEDAFKKETADPISFIYKATVETTENDVCGFRDLIWHPSPSRV